MSTNISWTDETWNPLVGCSCISPGCARCYAATAAASPRLQQFPQYQKVKDWDGTVEFVESQLLKPMSWKKPKRIFVCSMSDLFHENVPDEWIDKVLAIASLCPQHTFQILTKRPERALEYFDNTTVVDTLIQTAPNYIRHVKARLPLPNTWIGTTVENQAMADKRVSMLLEIPAAVRFLSCEPLLEEINLTFTNYVDDWNNSTDSGCSKISWVIVGGESGKGARECHIDWVRSQVLQCQSADVPVFVKQLGSNPVFSESDYPSHFPHHYITGKGGDLDEFPNDLKIREFPSNA
jgi:protein gp37